MESDGVRHRILLSLSTTPLGECRAPYSPLSADIESFRQLLCLPGGWTVRVSRRAPAAYRAASVRTNPQDLHLAPARQPATPGRRMPNALPSSRHWRGVRTPRRVPRSAHALELGVIRLAGERAAPRVGARDAELRERPERVRVDPRLPERARLGHALLVGLLVGGGAALLEVQEHPRRHGSDLADGLALGNRPGFPEPARLSIEARW